MAFGRITRGEQRFFLNETEVNGVQNAQIQYQLGGAPTIFLGGIAGADSHPVGGVSASANVDMLMMNAGDDPFYAFTGHQGFNGYILRGKNSDKPYDNFSFQSGYLTSYSTSWGMGTLPSISAGIEIFNEAGRLHLDDIPSSLAYSVPTSMKSIPDPGAVDITLQDDLRSNRLMSYSISVNCTRNPIFYLGSRYASFVDLVSPVVVACDFQIEVEDYVAGRVSSYPCETTKRDLIVNIKEKGTDSVLRTYSFADLQLASESYQVGVEGNAIVNASYVGYIPVRS
jgi:hypothetical protein